MGIRWWMLGFLGMAGCHSPSTPPSPASRPQPISAKPKDRFQELFDQVHSGNYQLDACLTGLEKARKAAKTLAPKAGGEAQVALIGVTGNLDEAGKTLSEAHIEQGTLAEFRKDFDARDEKRLQSIDLELQALDTLQDAQTTLEDLNSNAPPEHKAALKLISDEVDEAEQSLEDAVVALGGKIPDESSKS